MKKHIKYPFLMMAFALMLSSCTEFVPGYDGDDSKSDPSIDTNESNTTPTEDSNTKPSEDSGNKPTESPTEVPTETPTEVPTESPTEVPTETPTEAPTETPTVKPTETPTETPTENEDVLTPVSEYNIVETTASKFDPSKYDDPYINVNKTQFYNNYTMASDYVDAYYRTKHGLLSGEYIKEGGRLPSRANNPVVSGEQYYKNANVRFEVNDKNERISYTINTLDDTDYKIYSSGMYISKNDVAAYLFAFNDIPHNYLSGCESNVKDEAFNQFGELGRVNFTLWSGRQPNRWQYEPYLYGQEDKTLFYREVDFGVSQDEGHYYTYNQMYGGKNSRGIYRFVTANSYDDSYWGNRGSTSYGTPNPVDVADRYVYYTYNHYNDFCEYLNYYDGWAAPFGNTTAGNREGKYNPKNPPSEFIESKLAKF